MSITGTPDEPSKAGLSIADIAAGMYAYSNILAALLQRQHDGLGRRIDISMLEAMGEWMGYPLYYAFYYPGDDPVWPHWGRFLSFSLAHVAGFHRRLVGR